MTSLNKRYDYGLDLFLLSIDEGITGYRDDSLQTVRRNQDEYGVPLRVVSYKDIYDGWTMDKVVRETGLRSNCTYCGVFRRSALERGARLERADIVATGHNADDVAETVLMNILRGDTARLGRCVDPITGGDAAAPSAAAGVTAVPRCKPLMMAYEKEIVLYAMHNKLDYFSTECVYSPNAYRGFAREYIKAIEAARATSILDTIAAGRAIAPLYVPKRQQPVPDSATAQSAAPSAAASSGLDAAGAGSAVSGRAEPVRRVKRRERTVRPCDRCGLMTSQRLCQACTLLDTLEESRSAGRAGMTLAYEGGSTAPEAAASSGGEVPATAPGNRSAEGARLVPASAAVVAVRGGTGVRGGPDEVLRLSAAAAEGGASALGSARESGAGAQTLAETAKTLSSVSWASGQQATVRGRVAL
jgi:cytoplasmic tRNA 2-thiolation protein 1